MYFDDNDDSEELKSKEVKMYVCMFVHAQGPQRLPCKAGQAIFLRFNKCTNKKINKSNMAMNVILGQGKSAKKDNLEIQNNSFCYLFYAY